MLVMKGDKMEKISQISPFENMFSGTLTSSNPRRIIRRKNVFSRSSKGRFYALTRLASDTHQNLTENGSPLRFCVYGDQDDLSMDIIALDKTNKISQSFTRSLNNDNLETIVKRVHNQMGLILDYSV
jgi:hypothetical protein